MSRSLPVCCKAYLKHSKSLYCAWPMHRLEQVQMQLRTQRMKALPCQFKSQQSIQDSLSTYHLQCVCLYHTYSLHPKLMLKRKIQQYYNWACTDHTTHLLYIAQRRADYSTQMKVNSQADPAGTHTTAYEQSQSQKQHAVERQLYLL